MTAPKLQEHTPKILVADPDVHHAGVYPEMLGLNEQEFVQVIDGRDAALKALRQHFALIIANTHLPLVDGYTLCEILRTDLSTRTSPIMLVTSDSRASVLERALQAGADAVLVKPVEAGALRREAQRLIRRSHDLRNQSNGIRLRVLGQLRKSNALLSLGKTLRSARLARKGSRRCQSCDRPLTFEFTHQSDVSLHSPEEWDYYTCSAGCGRFEFRPRT